jgi:DNA polymerase III subunit beta
MMARMLLPPGESRKSERAQKMKSIVNRRLLSEIVKLTSGIVPRRSTLPILNNIKIEGRNGHIEVVATDLDMHLSVEIPAENNVAGAITLPARRLGEILAKCAAGDVMVETTNGDGPRSPSAATEDGKVVLHAGATRITLDTINAEEFPLCSSIAAQVALNVDGAALAGLLKSVSFAMSSDETRHVLNGVLLKVEAVGTHEAAQQRGPSSKQLTAVATDGKRLVVNSIPVSDKAAGFAVIVPRPMVAQLEKLTANAATVLLAVEYDTTTKHPKHDVPNNESLARQLQATFVAPVKGWSSVDAAKNGIAEIGVPFRLVCVAIEGSYPNYKQVIPTETRKIVRMNAETTADVVARVATLAGGSNEGVKLEFGKDFVCVSAQMPDCGQASESFQTPRQALVPPFCVSYNASYLMDVLRASTHKAIKGGSELVARFTDAKSPVAFTQRAPNWLCVLMPLTLQ